jgi:uncharacterized membrane protein
MRSALLRATSPQGSGAVERAPLWRSLLALGLSLFGLGVSIYLTIAHFGGAPLVCSNSGVINCLKVTTSTQSYFLHAPVAILGLGFYTVLTALNLPVAWRSNDRRVHIARLAMLVLGMGFALYLVSAELLIIGAICLWCTSVHIVTFALFVLVVQTVPQMLGWGRREAVPAEGAPRRPAANGTNGRPSGDRLPRSARR